jgi:hypothetical protein
MWLLPGVLQLPQQLDGMLQDGGAGVENERRGVECQWGAGVGVGSGRGRNRGQDVAARREMMGGRWDMA